MNLRTSLNFPLSSLSFSHFFCWTVFEFSIVIHFGLFLRARFPKGFRCQALPWEPLGKGFSPSWIRQPLPLISRVSRPIAGWWREEKGGDGREAWRGTEDPFLTSILWDVIWTKISRVYVDLCVVEPPPTHTHTHPHEPPPSRSFTAPQAPSHEWNVPRSASGCVCGKAKPPWHTKDGERCYLLSKLSLCLPYISAPKPPRLPITERKTASPRERVLETK